MRHCTKWNLSSGVSCSLGNTTLSKNLQLTNVEQKGRHFTYDICSGYGLAPYKNLQMAVVLACVNVLNVAGML